MPRARIHRKAEFESSHFMRVPTWSEAENERAFGRLTRPHGHNYVVEAGVEGPIDKKNFWVVNIKDLDDAMRDWVVEPLDHKCLNLDVPFFQDRNPTCENLALYVWQALDGKVGNCTLCRTAAKEYDWLGASYFGEIIGGLPMARLTRTYEFSAVHRLHRPELSDEENEAIFGKCSWPNGHGHSYRAEIAISGPIHAETGMVFDLALLDRIVQSEVIDRLDFKNLNEEVPELKGQIPTTEVLARFIYQAVKPHIAAPAALKRTRIYETHKSWFDYEEE